MRRDRGAVIVRQARRAGKQPQPNAVGRDTFVASGGPFRAPAKAAPMPAAARSLS
jgi:hypothetical protein